MAKVISTFGTAENFVKSALMGLGATQENANGRFYVDGSMVDVALSQVVAEAIYIDEIFRDGQSVTAKYTTDRESGAVRIMLDTPFDFTSRTLSYGGRLGTTGNGGLININPPQLPVTDEIMVYLNQVNDQAMLFPDLAKEFIPLDVMSKKISSYARAVVQDRSASTLAEIIAYNVFRALNDGENINQFDGTADNAYAELLGELNAKMDNGDIVSGAYTYSTTGRTIIGRPTFINGLFSKKSGVILNGNDMAQQMLKNYDLEARMGDRNFVGTGYKGNFGQFDFQSCPEYIWTLAEKYLGLSKGALDNVYAIAVSAEATAMGKVTDLGVKLIDANECRGIKAQPLNKWGHEAFRKCQIIGKSTLSTSDLVTMGFSADERKYPVAPSVVNRENKVTVPVYNEAGTIVGYKEIANTVTAGGGNYQSGLEAVKAPVANPASKTFTGASLSVALTSATSGADIYYTIDGTDPITSATRAKYTTALSITATTTVKAYAIKVGMLPSSVIAETYTK